MLLKLLTWNCRYGLRFANKMQIIKQLVQKNRVSMCGLMETKTEIVDDFIMWNYWPNINFHFHFDNSEGSLACLCVI